MYIHHTYSTVVYRNRLRNLKSENISLWVWVRVFRFRKFQVWVSVAFNLDKHIKAQATFHKQDLLYQRNAISIGSRVQQTEKNWYKHWIKKEEVEKKIICKSGKRNVCAAPLHIFSRFFTSHWLLYEVIVLKASNKN